MSQTRSVRPHERDDLEEVEVAPLELFFDLVFVFALTQVTAYMAHEIDHDRGVEGLVRGVLVMMLLWWALDRLGLALQRHRRRGAGPAR